MSYTSITKEEFDEKLQQGKGWVLNTSGNEYVYDFHLQHYPIIVKVASSIRLDSKISRNKGADAIRVFAVEKESLVQKAKIKSGILKAKRVYRTTNWRDNLQKAVLVAIKESKKRYDKYRR